MDIAQLGFSIDTAGLQQGTAALDSVTAAANRTATAATQVGTAVSQAGSAAAVGFVPIATAATTAAEGIGVIAPAASAVGPALVAAGAAGAAGLSLMVPATQQVGGAVDELSRTHIVRLESELVHMGEGLALGGVNLQSLSTAALRAGVTLGQSGLSGLVAGLSSTFGFLASPIALASAALVGLGAAAVYGMRQYQLSLDDARAGAVSMGATIQNITQHDIIETAQAAQKSWMGISTSAVQVGSTLAQTGDIAKTSLTQGIQVATALGTALNVGPTDAAKTLAEALTAMAEQGDAGLSKLNQQFGFLTPTIKQNVDTLISQNDVVGATAIVLNTLQDKLQQAGIGFKNTAEGAQTFLAQAYGLTSQTDILKQSISEVQQQISSYDGSVREAAAAVGVWTPSLQELQQQLVQLQQKLAALQPQAASNSFQQLGNQALDFANKINPLPGTITTLTGKLHDMQTAMQNPAIQQDAAAMQTLSGAVDMLQGKISGLLPVEQQMSLQEAATLQTINARTDSEKVLAAGVEARVAAQLKGLGIGAQEQAQLIAETETQAKLGVQWTGFNDKINLQLDAQAYKLGLQKEAIGGSAAAIQDAAIRSQLFDQYLSEALQHGITNFSQIQQGFQAWIAQFAPAISDIDQTKAALDAATASAKSLASVNFNNLSSAGAGLSSGYVPGYGANKGYDPFGGYVNTVTGDPTAAGDYNGYNGPSPASQINAGPQAVGSTGDGSGGGPQDNGGGSYEQGGSFIIPGPPSSKDNVMVRFHAAKGERVTITAAHEVARQGFAKGGSFITGFTDSEGTLLTEASAHGSGIATGHASTKFHEPKVAKPKAPKKPKALTKHELAVAARNDYSYVGMPGFEEGGQFTVGGHGDSMVVEFPAATGERIAITPAHHPQHGFAGGGTLDIAPGAGLSSIGGGPSGAYAGIHSFAGAGVSSTPNANTSGINALAAKAPGGVTSGLTSIAGGSQEGRSDLSSFADALGLASFMSAPSPVAAAGATTQSSSVGSASGGRMIFNIPVTIVANDPTSFSNSSAQIASTLRRAVLFATSHMGP